MTPPSSAWLRTSRLALAVCVSGLARWSAADVQVWTVVPQSSDVRIHVGKSGLLSVAGHTHEVIAPAVAGTIRFDRQRPEQAEIELTFDASRLKVTGKGEPAGDVPQVQQTMVSDKVLDVGKYPSIVFRSRQIEVRTRSGDQMRLRVAGDLTLHGVTRPIDGPVDVKLSADRLVGTGSVNIKQTNFGIQPITAGLGAVKVKDEVSVTFTFTAER